jgi:molecular chaperone GrpE
MSERRDAAAGDGEPQLKVVDRRRFTPEGDPIDAPGKEPAVAPEPAPAAPEDEADGRDAMIAEQASRIDELSRAYANLVEDNKAFRQRLEREKARVIEAERFSVAQALLDASDDLDRALAAVMGAGETGDEAVRGLVEGVRLSLGTLQKRIAELGAERIPVVGEPFDPRVAEAVDTVSVADEAQDGMVLHEVRPGYRVGDRVLRPARVRVGRLARA